MKARPYLCCALLVSSCGSIEAAERERLTAEVEAGMRMPAGAQAIGFYDRFYTTDQHGDVIGTFTAVAEAKSPTGRRQWVKDQTALPIFFDGGCGVIFVKFDVRSRKLVSAQCNEDS